MKTIKVISSNKGFLYQDIVKIQDIIDPCGFHRNS